MFGQLDLDRTPLQFMKDKYAGNGSLDHEHTLRAHLAGCGVSSDLQGTLIRGLSGGQRSRVAMAATSYAQVGLVGVVAGASVDSMGLLPQQ